MFLLFSSPLPPAPIPENIRNIPTIRGHSFLNNRHIRLVQIEPSDALTMRSERLEYQNCGVRDTRKQFAQGG
jgi:hypothetical protein